jgi:hypothetical protein
MRLVLGGIAGAATAAGGAVVLGDYPLTGSVPWLAAVVIPLLIGGVMTSVAGGRPSALWVATGPLAGLAMAWGVRIATGWGLDPVPASAWAAGATSLVWPPLVGLLHSRGLPLGRRRPGAYVAPGAAAHTPPDTRTADPGAPAG